MPNATARGLKRYLQLKGKNKAKDFQKITVESWLEENLKSIPFSDVR